MTVTTEHERQRVRHLVLGAPRPRAQRTRRGKKATAAITLADGVEAQVSLRERWSHKQGTPQTLEQVAQAAKRPGALVRLVASGAIDFNQLAAAEQILAVHHLLTADVRVRTASLETRISGGMRGGDGEEAWGRVRDQRAYDAWRTGLPCAALVLAIVVEDLGVVAAAARHGMSARRAGRLLGEALTGWWIAKQRAGGGASSGTSRM